jgi:hypothetical protein
MLLVQTLAGEGLTYLLQSMEIYSLVATTQALC